MANLPRLSIAAITLTIPVSPEQQSAVQERLASAGDVFPDTVATLTRRGRYLHRYALTTSSGEAIFILSQPKKADEHYLALEYSPEAVGPDGTALLAEYLLYVLGPTYQELVHGGIVKQMTVVWELNNVLLDDLCVSRFRGKPKQIALISNADLALQEIHVGYGSERQVVFSQQPSCVRVEYRYGKGEYALGDLFARLENPLISLTLRRYAEMPDLMDETQSRLLFDALRLRGKERVLAMYPEAERGDIEEAMGRFELIEASKLRLALWHQLRGRLAELLPAQSD
jgi:hypothetical protein